MAIVDFVTRK